MGDIDSIVKNKQYFKFCSYGFLKNLRFFDAFFILFLIEKGLSFTEIGILYAVREILINVFEIPSGVIADTFGRKGSLAGSLLLYLISFIVFYFSSNFWAFLVAFSLYGIADAFRSGTHKGMIMDYLRINHWSSYKIAYYGYTRSWSQKGSALSSLIAGIIVFYSGSYESIFLFSIIPYLLNFFLILSYPKELDRSLKADQSTSRYSMANTWRSLFKELKHVRVLKIINSSASHTAYLHAVRDYIQPLMVNVALLIPLMTDIDSEKKNGIIIGVIYFFIYLITSRASKLASRISGIKKVNISNATMLAGFIFGLVCGILFVFDLWIFSLIAFVGIYVIENIRKPILTGYIADHVPNEILTSVISVQSLLRTLLTAFIALVFGIMADKFGIGISFVIVSGILILISAILSLQRVNNPSKKTRS
jgi:MFS family permease